MGRRLVGLATHVRPVFMLPVIATSVCGALLAATVSPVQALLHAAGAGMALVVAHLRDGHVDGHVRGEETPSLSVTEYRVATVAAAAVTLAFAISLVVTSGSLAAGSVLVLLALALLHAPYLDRRPVPVTVDYPVGIAITLVGGYAAQTTRVTAAIGAIAVTVVLFLAGVKVGIDRLDAAFDRRIGKRTVPVAVGPTGATWTAVGCFITVAAVVVGLVVARTLTPAAVLATVAALGCAASAGARSRTAVRIQMGLSYVFLGSLAVSVCRWECAGWRLLSRLSLASVVREVPFYFVGGGPLIEHISLAALL